jgi:hypothetical protein
MVTRERVSLPAASAFSAALRKALIVAVSTTAALIASALYSETHAAITLSFEGLQNLEPILNYYNGGTGGFGSGPGPNYGVSFTADSLAVKSTTAGGTGSFSNNPSGSTIAFFLSGAGDTMDVKAGFDTGFSFFYAAALAGSVGVFSGLDGTGTELASLSLPTTTSPYTVWDPIGVAFSGVAESVVFGGSANFIGFDDITLGSVTPEPASGPIPGAGLLSYIALGLLAIGSAVRKRWWQGSALA